MSTSTTSTAVEEDAVAGFLTDLLGRNPRAAIARLHDDIEWSVPSDPAFGGGVYRGRDAVLDFFALVGRLSPSGLRIAELREWQSSGGSVIEAVLEGRTASRTAYRNRYAFVIEMEDGTVRRVREYTDTSHAERLLAGARRVHGTRVIQRREREA